MKWMSALLLFIAFNLQAAEWFEQLKLPQGFTLKHFAKVPDARQMSLSPKGNLYVGSMDKGAVHVVDKAGKVTTLMDGLTMPQGVLWHNNDLYIAEVSKVSKIANFNENDLKSAKLVKVKDLPSDRHHGWKTIALGPDGKLYVPVGAPCNICNKPLPYAALHRMNLDGSQFETVASGIRNTVGFAWNPLDKKLYFTDNGRDMLGDDIPPEEINVVNKVGEHFGYPYLHGSSVRDPQFAAVQPKGLEITKPIQEIQAHSAALGIAFFPIDKYPKEYHGCFLVAEHGSWNRSKKAGYQITKGCIKDGKVVGYAPFITGFKNGETTLGRPVHFLFLEDGSFYFSDDYGGNVFQVSRK